MNEERLCDGVGGGGGAVIYTVRRSSCRYDAPTVTKDNAGIRVERS